MTVIGDPFFPLVFLASTGTDGFNTGKGGDLSITAQNFEMADSYIDSGNFFSFFNFGEGAGTAGDVNISAAERIDLNFSFIITDSFDFIFETGGLAGDVTLAAPEIHFDNFSQISTAGWAQGGNVIINADILTLSNQSDITTLTRTQPGGAVTITARVIELSKSNIISMTSENANAGDITVTATERLSLLNPKSSFSPDDLPSSIASNSSAVTGIEISGAPGDISIFTPLLVIDGGSKINSSSGSAGIGGNISVNSQEIIISGETSEISRFNNFGNFPSSGIFTGSFGGNCLGPCGDSGNITIFTDSIVMNAGAQINSSTVTEGSGGEIHVTASDNISISGSLVDGTPGGVFSGATGTGDGGNIALIAGQNFTLSNGATVSAGSSGPANAGSIQVQATDTILLDGATITTEAAQASGGNIKLTAQDLIQLNDSTISSSVQGNATTGGGDINLDPDFIILQNSQVLAKAVAGQGGNITLIANNAVLVDSFSTLDASSALGISGSVTIEAPTKFLSGAILPLEPQPVNVAALYGARCAAGAGGNFSTFVDSKTDSLSPTPGTFLASPLLNLASSAHAVAERPVGQQSPILTASIAPLVLGHAGEPTTACP
ncbi:MAG: hypothetical protein OEZ05_15115, partial [Nitrospirota bacterium]|nr:hypothetical protein [Nitrospirota bacterium]